MVDTTSLREYMILRGHTISTLANEIGISSRTLSKYMKTGVFKTDDATLICQILSIKNPGRIFFAKDSSPISKK